MATAVESNPAGIDILPKDEDNKFQRAIAAWRNIDLSKLVSSLDESASDLVAHQRDALVQRKDLAQKTKDFRKLDDQTKLVEVKTILKSYQTYIDLITNQSKAIHSAFLQVYSPLSEAPDPYPLLEASIDSLLSAEETVPKLTDENAQLQKQVASLTAQLDNTEKQLEQERTARKELESTRQDKIKSVESSWNAVLEEKQNNWEAKEKSLEEKVEHQDRLIKEIKASYEVNQRLNKGEEPSGSGSGPSVAEVEILHSELDRANIRLAEVEARNEQFRLELAQSATSINNIAVEDDPAFLQLQSENTSLLRRLETSRIDRASEKRNLDTQLRSIERELNSLKSDRETLKQKLTQWSDYDNLKQELQVLKSIEFATGDDDQEQDTIAGSGAGSGATNEDDVIDSNNASTKQTLEQLLLSRNKKLSNELTLLRVSHQDLQEKLAILQHDLSTSNKELEKSKTLASVLENDLEKVQQEAANSFPSAAMSVAGTYTSRYPHSSYRSVRGSGGGGGVGRSTSPTSSIISGFDPNSSGSTYEGNSGTSILPMITAQRDRYKKKIAELDIELQKSYQTIQSLRSEVAALQKDNLTLYEKTRYVQSYHPATSAPQVPTSTVIQMEGLGGNKSGDSNTATAFSRYQTAYEANMSPFSAFRSRESARAVKRMNAPERAVFQAARMILATRLSRNLFATYCVGLHLLVMVMVFSGSSTTSRPHPASLAATLSRNGGAGSGSGGGVGGGVGGGK